MWQDGIALFIVVIAVLWLLRIYAPRRLFRFGARREADDSAARVPAGGCSGCGSGASCSKVQVKIYPVAVGRRERFSSDPHQGAD